MLKSVPNIPTYEETFGLIDNYLSDDEFDIKEDDEDIKKMIVIMLSLLQEFYITHQFDTAFDMTSEYFEESIQKLQESLKDNLKVLFKEYVQNIQEELNAKWYIPENTVEMSYELEDVINTGIDNLIGSLTSELKHKATYYEQLAIVTGDFNINSNFRRTIKGLTNLTRFNAQTVKNRIVRDYDMFVYGQEAPSIWVVSGRNTCAWCYKLAAMGEMPLSWWPVDHPNGGCKVIVVNSENYSDEYLKIKLN